MRITHATPSAAFARTAYRGWEGNQGTPDGCADIAQQLVTGEIGSKLDVALGGGRGNFQPNSIMDRDGNRGLRTDGRNLLREYMFIKTRQGKRPAVVQTAVS
jgi:alkaline phosphatase